nr:hypothetical protein [Serratia marcescens]
MTRRERRAFNEYLIAEAKKREASSPRSTNVPKNRRSISIG